MNDTLIKTEELNNLKEKAAKWDKLVKLMPDQIYPSDYSNLGHAAVKIHVENKQ